MFKRTIRRLAPTAAALALAPLAVLSASGTANAGTPGDGCAYNTPVGHRTNVSISVFISGGVQSENAGYIDQWYSAGCRRTAAHFHPSTFWNNSFGNVWHVGLEVLDNTPSGSALNAQGWQYSDMTSGAGGLGQYSYGVGIDQDYKSFSSHAVFFGPAGNAVCQAFTDTHTYSNGSNTSSHDVDVSCT